MNFRKLLGPISLLTLISIGLLGCTAESEPDAISELTTVPEQTAVPEQSDQSKVLLSPEQIEESRGDRPVIYKDGCYLDYVQDTLSNCVFGDGSSGKRVFLVGDSHAAQWAPALIPIAESQGWELHVHAKPACPFAINVHSNHKGEPYPSCEVWVDNLRNEIVKTQPDFIVFSGYGRHPVYSEGRLLEADDEENELELAQGMTRALSEVLRAGVQVVVIKDTPLLAFNSPDCLLENLEDSDQCVTSYQEAVLDQPNPEEYVVSQLPKVNLFDFSKQICIAHGECAAIDGETVIWRDVHHMTATFAATLTKPLKLELQDIGIISIS